MALTPDRTTSPRAGRTDGLRHAGASRSSTPACRAAETAEAAERTGHAVDVLLKVYAKCLDGDRDRMKARIEAVLAD